MNFILYLYVVTAMHGSQYGNVHERSWAWQHAGTFVTDRACKNAVLVLGVDQGKARCVPNH